MTPSSLPPSLPSSRSYQDGESEEVTLSLPKTGDDDEGGGSLYSLWREGGREGLEGSR